MVKLLVTGGAGFIGSHLVDKLIEKGHEVIVIDNLSTGKKENLNPKADFYKADICDFEKIKPLFQNVDYVFHLAAIPRMPISIKEPISTSKVNILGTISVFKAGIDNKVKRIISISSSAIYGKQDKLPFQENMVPHPISPYALQKLVGEKFAILFTNFYKIPIVSLRYFNIYGPRIDSDSDYGLVIGKFLKQKQQEKPLTIFGNGEQTRAFCYIDDVVEATIRAAESENIKGGEVINIGEEKSWSVNYLSKLISKKIKYLPPRPGDLLHTKADISLAKNLFNWKPKTSFEQGIEKTRQWFKNNFKEI